MEDSGVGGGYTVEVGDLARLSLALVGDKKNAVKAAGALKSRYPGDTIVRFNICRLLIP